VERGALKLECGSKLNEEKQAEALHGRPKIA
jgi:hypothetical protein